MVHKKMLGLSVAAFLIGAALAACSSPTAPAPLSMAGTWSGSDQISVAAGKGVEISMVITEVTADGILSGSGVWDTTPFTIAYGWQDGATITMHLTSPLFGTADVSGSIAPDARNGAMFTGRLLVNAQPLVVKLGRVR
jgi:hypothetical protein